MYHLYISNKSHNLFISSEDSKCTLSYAGRYILSLKDIESIDFQQTFEWINSPEPVLVWINEFDLQSTDVDMHEIKYIYELQNLQKFYPEIFI